MAAMSKEAPLVGAAVETSPEAVPPPSPLPLPIVLASAVGEDVVRGEESAGELRMEGDAAALLFGKLACELRLLREEREAAAAAAENEV